MTARCDLSDLPVKMCACRVHGPQDAPRAESLAAVGYSFPASFPGQCLGCEQRVHEGDLIVRTADSGYIHAECAS